MTTRFMHTKVPRAASQHADGGPVDQRPRPMTAPMPESLIALLNKYSRQLTPEDVRRRQLKSFHLPQLPPLPDTRPSLRNLTPPPDMPRVQREVAETISPTMGAYGIAGLGTKAALDAKRGKADPETLIPLALSIFAGPMAKTANLAALERAQQMAARGESRGSIWKAGWFQGKDGKWRWEIDDSAMRVTPSPDWAPATRHFRHPALEAAYPEMRSIDSMVRISPHSRSSGFVERSGPETMLLVSAPTKQNAAGVAVHELSHALPQAIEGFEAGATPATVASSPAYRAFLERLLRAGHPVTPEVKDAWARLLYHRMAGEVEARNAQRRLSMTPEERRAIPPWETEDVPPDRQVTFSDLLRGGK